ncbi:MAG: phosphatidylserine decarboxylase [Desulfobacteraceae bacterium]|nr:phosphatidylserine decarboxylase [Desulfobacteraceae bacterium]
MLHQYIDRKTLRVVNERPYGDRLINLFYDADREEPALLFRALASARMSRLLGFLNYDSALGARITGADRFLRRLGVDLTECVDDPRTFGTARDLFERKIRYWETRPMPEGQAAVVSPADARLLLGSFAEASQLFLKGKFFDFEELLGIDKPGWLASFRGGDYAILRLTPDKYHYNHMPVSGRVADFYEISGRYHSCNPRAVLVTATPYSKNKRVVTIVDTDVAGGTGVGLVAMIEVVALMIGEIAQCYSEERYEQPQPVRQGMLLVKGQPKSLFRPGSSTVVLIFQPDRIAFSPDLVRNQLRTDVQSRFTRYWLRPLAETDVKVRSAIGQAL